VKLLNSLSYFNHLINTFNNAANVGGILYMEYIEQVSFLFLIYFPSSGSQLRRKNKR
jgi:hypothetical protein